MIEVIRVPDDAAESLETVGSKRKFWYYGEDSRQYLFKETTPNTGEDWSEKIASNLCEMIELPHASYELARWRGRRGVVSPSFVPAGGRLVHGNEFLSKVVQGYPQTKFFNVRQHTLGLVLAIMKIPAFGPPLGWKPFRGVDSTSGVFIGYLMLDAWIANQDRHHENWAFIVVEDSIHLAPSYDHASALGRNETDENRNDRLHTHDQRRNMNRYVERARSAFYSSPNSSKPMSTLEAFSTAAQRRPSCARAWLERLQDVSAMDIQKSFDMIPQSHISTVAIEFAQMMLRLNRERLLRIL